MRATLATFARQSQTDLPALSTPWFPYHNGDSRSLPRIFRGTKGALKIPSLLLNTLEGQAVTTKLPYFHTVDGFVPHGLNQPVFTMDENLTL